MIKTIAYKMALAEANHLRKKHGYSKLDELKPGIRKDGNRCPMARSVPAIASDIDGFIRVLFLCLPAVPFILLFDRGHYPHLDAALLGIKGKPPKIISSFIISPHDYPLVK